MALYKNLWRYKYGKLLEFVVNKGFHYAEVERFMGLKGTNISQELIRMKFYKKIDEPAFKRYSKTRQKAKLNQSLKIK